MNRNPNHNPQPKPNPNPNQLHECLHYPTNQNLDRLCEIISTAEDPQVLIQKIVDSRRLKSLYGQISIRKRKLLYEIQELYTQIQELQKETIQRHNQIATFEESISRIFPYLPPAWQEKFILEEEEEEEAEEVEEEEAEDEEDEEDEEESNLTRDQTNSKPKPKSNPPPFNKRSHPKKEYHHRLKNLSKHEYIQTWKRNYQKIDFDTLKSKHSLIENPKYCESIKMMEKNIIRKRYNMHNPEHKKAYKREIAIYKYLNLCRFTPPMLYYNPDKGTIYLPACGKIAKPKDKNRISLKAMLKLLDNEWGVSLTNLTDTKSPTLDEQLEWLLIDPTKKHYYLFDFSHPGWKVEPKH